MKNVNAILSIALFLFLIAGCTGSQQSTDDVITVDVTASYPKKELILQDFLDVEYVPLETTDEFTCQDLVLDVTKNMILLRNHPEDGNIFVFDRNGKALKKINRKGQGGEEYSTYRRIALDEDKAEIFVIDSFVKRILAYDLDGNFKRILKQGDILYFTNVFNFDSENLIGINEFQEDVPSFLIVSKQDGHVSGEIQIPYQEKISVQVKFEMNNQTYSTRPETYNQLLPYFDRLILVEPSADTVYSYQTDHTMTPFIVRTPPVQSMNPVFFLFPSLFTERYYFMDATKKEVIVDGEWFPATHLMYDKEEKSIFEYTVYNDDYTDKKQVSIHKAVPVINEEVAAWLPLQATDLIEAYEKGKLKGELKEIAAGLNEESNPVIMLLKHKK
jgi:hypothetical protein